MKILVSSEPAHGHFNPTQPVVLELVRRGHEVVWLSDEDYRDRITKTGARFAPMSKAARINIPGLDAVLKNKSIGPLTKLSEVCRICYIESLQAQLRDYQTVLESFDADIFLIDWRTYAAHTLHDLSGLPYATLGITPLMTSQPEIPPWNTAWLPPKTVFGRLLNSFLYWYGNGGVYPKVLEQLNQERAKVGLDALPSDTDFTACGRSELLHLMTTTPALEFPRSNLHPSIRFIGPLLVETGDNEWAHPPWWDEMLAHPRESVVHVTQGTIADDSDKLIKPTLRVLGQMPGLLVIITLTARDSSIAFPPDGADKIPANVRIAEYIPHTKLLPHVGLMVTNAGFGAVLTALSNGVPLICAGRSEDKAEVTSRVVWSGAGVDLGTEKPTERAIEVAVLDVLKNPKYREAARRVQQDFATHNGPVEAVDELERVVRVTRASPSRRRDE
jgi:MGT family glycosyltransferase